MRVKPNESYKITPVGGLCRRTVSIKNIKERGVTGKKYVIQIKKSHQKIKNESKSVESEYDNKTVFRTTSCLNCECHNVDFSDRNFTIDNNYVSKKDMSSGYNKAEEETNRFDVPSRIDSCLCTLNDSSDICSKTIRTFGSTGKKLLIQFKRKCHERKILMKENKSVSKIEQKREYKDEESSTKYENCSTHKTSHKISSYHSKGKKFRTGEKNFVVEFDTCNYKKCFKIQNNSVKSTANKETSTKLDIQHKETVTSFICESETDETEIKPSTNVSENRKNLSPEGLISQNQEKYSQKPIKMKNKDQIMRKVLIEYKCPCSELKFSHGLGKDKTQLRDLPNDEKSTRDNDNIKNASRVEAKTKNNGSSSDSPPNSQTSIQKPHSTTRLDKPFKHERSKPKPRVCTCECPHCQAFAKKTREIPGDWKTSLKNCVKMMSENVSDFFEEKIFNGLVFDVGDYFFRKFEKYSKDNIVIELVK